MSATRPDLRDTRHGHGHLAAPDEACDAGPPARSRVRQAARQAVISGTAASLASTAALVACGSRQCDSAFAPVNAISHWLWKDESIGQNSPTWRHTATGYGIHHAMSILWAAHYEALMMRVGRRRAALGLVGGLGVAALACFVDLKCTPRRLTPGFERRLPPRSLALMYVAFGIGLALAKPPRRR